MGSSLMLSLHDMVGGSVSPWARHNGSLPVPCDGLGLR